MQRIALLLVIPTLAVVGCHKPKPTAEPIQSTDAGYDSLEPDIYANDTSVATPYEPASTYTPPTTTRQSSYASGAMSSPEPVTLSSRSSPSMGRSHTVVKGDTLYRLARQYYNNQSRWRDIYEANRDVLSDPNVLRVGQELRIP